MFLFADPGDSSAKWAKADKVFDFVSGTDKIDLHNMDADTGLAGDQAFAFVYDGTPTANSAWLTTRAEGLYLCGDVDGDAHRDFAIFLDGVIGFVPADVFA